MNPYATNIHKQVLSNLGSTTKTSQTNTFLASTRKELNATRYRCEQLEASLTQLNQFCQVREMENALDDKDTANIEALYKDIDNGEKGILVAKIDLSVKQAISARLEKESHRFREGLISVESKYVKQLAEKERKKEKVTRLTYERDTLLTKYNNLTLEMQDEKEAQQSVEDLLQTELSIHGIEDCKDLAVQQWTREVSEEAAETAYIHTSGRLKRIWALQKLLSNHLQWVLLRSTEATAQETEEFRYVQEVTGISSVQTTVEQFRNRNRERTNIAEQIEQQQKEVGILKENYADKKALLQSLKQRCIPKMIVIPLEGLTNSMNSRAVRYILNSVQESLKIKAIPRQLSACLKKADMIHAELEMYSDRVRESCRQWMSLMDQIDQWVSTVEYECCVFISNWNGMCEKQYNYIISNSILNLKYNFFVFFILLV